MHLQVVQVRANVKLRPKARTKLAHQAHQRHSATLLLERERELRAAAEECRQQLLQLEQQVSATAAETRQEMGLSKVRLRLMERVKVTLQMAGVAMLRCGCRLTSLDQSL